MSSRPARARVDAGRGFPRLAHATEALRLSLSLLNSDNELSDDMVRDIEDMDAILDQFLAIRDGRDEPVEEVDLADLVREVVVCTTSRKSVCACAWSRFHRSRCAGFRLGACWAT